MLSAKKLRLLALEGLEKQNKESKWAKEALDKNFDSRAILEHVESAARGGQFSTFICSQYVFGYKDDRKFVMAMPNSTKRGIFAAAMKKIAELFDGTVLVYGDVDEHPVKWFRVSWRAEDFIEPNKQDSNIVSLNDVWQQLYAKAESHADIMDGVYVDKSQELEKYEL